MGFLEFPNPVGWIESAKNAGMEREAANAFMSMVYSAQISFLWRSGSSKWAQWIGEGRALQDAAVAMYLSLRELEAKQFLTLAVPKDLLESDLSRFQTESVKK